MKQLLTIILIFVNFILFGQELLVPNGYEILSAKTGDLDKDGIDEKVIVYNTADSIDFGPIREIQILKSLKGTWTIWKKSRNAILEKEKGGPMDPFESVKIENGVLLISHSGGGLNKWRYTDKYRFQNNEFELFGYKSFYILMFEYIINCDFNISTGRIEYKKEFIDSEFNVSKTEKETFFKKDIKMNLNNRHLKDIKIVSPKYKNALHL